VATTRLLVGATDRPPDGRASSGESALGSAAGGDTKAARASRRATYAGRRGSLARGDVTHEASGDGAGSGDCARHAERRAAGAAAESVSAQQHAGAGSVSRAG
jgi:hypothetical protein